jgi:hypothetical protein
LGGFLCGGDGEKLFLYKNMRFLLAFIAVFGMIWYEIARQVVTK